MKVLLIINQRYLNIKLTLKNQLFCLLIRIEYFLNICI